MTLQQLLNEVYCLGFEDIGQIDDNFIFCANRALKSIALEFSKEKTTHIIIPKKQISYYLESYIHTPGENREINVSGTAYSFKYFGKGKFKLMDEFGRQEKELSDIQGEVRGIMKNSGTITFSGDNSFTVLDLTVFSSLPTSSIADIPIIYETMEYDLSDYIKDIMVITRAPYDKNGNKISNASIESNVLKVPKTFHGEVRITYKKLPQEITIDDLYKKVDLPDFCKHLLPILTASYVWLDDDIERSNYYMNIYNNEVGKIKFSFRNSHGGEYKDTTGWA